MAILAIRQLDIQPSQVAVWNNQVFNIPHAIWIWNGSLTWRVLIRSASSAALYNRRGFVMGGTLSFFMKTVRILVKGHKMRKARNWTHRRKNLNTGRLICNTKKLVIEEYSIVSDIFNVSSCLQTVYSRLFSDLSGSIVIVADFRIHKTKVSVL